MKQSPADLVQELVPKGEKKGEEGWEKKIYDAAQTYLCPLQSRWYEIFPYKILTL